MNFKFKKIVTLWLTLVLCAPSPKTFSQISDNALQPNIILIMADDLGYGDLGCYGQEKIQTPHIDALAAAGMRFTNFYSGSTVCAPSREALLTGMTTGHTFIRGNFLTDEEEDPAMPDDKITIAELLKKAGYRTGLYGKWGLGGENHGPELQGFDSSFCYLDQIEAHSYYPPYLYDNGKRVYINENKNGEKGLYSHDLFVDHTLNFIRNAKDGQPFFLYLPYTLPHGSYSLPPEEPYRSKDWKDVYKTYATMVSKLDRDVGKILQLLRDQGLSENTIVLFTSDNGPNLNFARFFGSNGPLRGGKRDLYDGGVRVPLVAYWPGQIEAGTTSDHIAASWDFLPTLCEIADVKPTGHIDGLSFLPALLGRSQEEHEYLYWENYRYNYNWYKPGNETPRNYLSNRAVRHGKWKAVQNQLHENHNSPLELYDLSSDIGEQHDVATKHPDVVREIKKIFSKSSDNDAPFFPYAPDSTVKLHVLNIEAPADMRDFFQYSDEGMTLVSSHRGAPALGYPENCLATLIHTLRHTWSIMEIDPHYTKDSIIVLMHDPTLERTSTGMGKVSDYTLAELKKFNLKDVHGKVTKFKIPTLDEALEWTKGKTVLILDMKDVPAEVRARKIMEHQAQTSAMVMCYSYEDAWKVYNLDTNIMMEVFIPDRASAEKFEQTGVPWSNVVAFVTHSEPKDPDIIDYLHTKGVMAIRGSSRNIDKQYSNDQISKKELLEGYQNLMEAGTDIIEADLGVQAGKEVMTERHQQNPKRKYFGYR